MFHERASLWEPGKQEEVMVARRLVWCGVFMFSVADCSLKHITGERRLNHLQPSWHPLLYLSTHPITPKKTSTQATLLRSYHVVLCRRKELCGHL
jgi:hypothetical protein